MRCISCNGRYDAGTCKKCHEDLKNCHEDLKKCHEDLKAKVAFLSTSQPDSFSDVILFAADGGSAQAAVPVRAHKAVLVSRSPVFNAMLENEMEESLSGTIKIRDVSYPTLRAFVNYLYTTEVVCLDQQLACDLLVMAEKYQVHHLKDLCQKFLVANLNWENSFSIYTFVHQHNAKKIIDAALTLIIDNMDKLTAREEYAELKEKDPQLVFEIYEAYLSKQVNKAAAQKGSSASYPPKFNWGGMYIGDYEEPPE
ncbi:BTB/POZ domain-containing protein At4g08455-like [Prunus dulcis]|uniref:BTB/POZ domain-containing protein At4g08455-like n=1 Tax=Prunus dulcis TaxID=3755 RepID=UPI0014826F3D|nr:BTB/POZ domain-containing protein At4g08455-like [Prunus dulcis]